MEQGDCFGTLVHRPFYDRDQKLCGLIEARSYQRSPNCLVHDGHAPRPAGWIARSFSAVAI